MVSVDTLADNKAFAEKEGADFPMLADPEKQAAEAYGVLPPVNPERPDAARLARRHTFYIGPDGKILDIDKGPTGRGVSPATAGADVVKKLEALGVKKKK